MNKKFIRIISGTFYAVLIVTIFVTLQAKAQEDNVDCRKSVLSSGATLLYRYRPGSTLTSIQICLPSGLSNEGKYLGTGISHFLEHLLFKRAKDKNSEEIRRKVKNMGGVVNASTGRDSVEFHITVPNEKFKEALILLTDMVIDVGFTEDELEAERQVVIREIKLKTDDPLSKRISLLFEEAYNVQSYKYPILGYEKDFLKLTREDIADYHARVYFPGNMVIGVVGGVRYEDVLPVAESLFVGYGTREKEPGVEIKREPEQNGERLKIQKIDSILGYMAIGFHTTDLYSPDLYSVDVLSFIAGEGKDSRFYKCLVQDKGLLYSVSSLNYTPKYPGLFIIVCSGSPEKLVEAREEIFSILTELKEGGISRRELERAKNLVLSEYFYLQERISRENDSMTNFELLMGNPEFPEEYVANIKKVKGADVKKIVSKYLTRNNSTTIFLVPEGGESYRVIEAERERVREAERQRVIESKSQRVRELRGQGVRELESQRGKKLESQRVRESESQGVRVGERQVLKTRAEDKILTLDNGLRIIIKERGYVPLVSITFASQGGLREENEKNNGISNFTAAVLLKETDNRSEGEIISEIEEMGGSVRAFSGKNSIGINLDIFEEDMDKGFDVFEDVLKNSVFSSEEIIKQKEKIIMSIKETEKDIFVNGMNRLRKVLFGEHPYSMSILGREDTVAAVSEEDIKSFYNDHFIPQGAVITVVGKLDTKIVARQLEKRFSDWESPNGAQKKNDSYRSKGQRRTDMLMNKEQSLVLAGFLGVKINDDRKYVLDVISAILSGSDGLLFFTAREKEGITYTSGALNVPGVAGPGYFFLYLATIEEDIEKAERIMAEVVEKISRGEISEEEIEASKYRLVSQYAHSLETNASMSMSMALDELYGVGFDHYRKYKVGMMSVTKEDIVDVGKDILCPGKASVVIVHSTK